MPPRGVTSPKRKRQYEDIKQSARKRGASTKRAKQLAARVVNKQRAESGETKTKTQRAGGKTRKTASAARTGRKTGVRKSTSSRSKTASGARKTGARKSTRSRSSSASRSKR